MADEFTPITSQEQLDQVIKGRIERAQAKAVERFADYDEIKAKAAEYDKSQEASFDYQSDRHCAKTMGRQRLAERIYQRVSKSRRSTELGLRTRSSLTSSQYPARMA